MDNLIYNISNNGNAFRADWQKSFLPTTAAVANEWHCLFRGAGNPAADAIANTGTNLAFQQLKDSTTNATGIQHGGDVFPSYKHIVNASAWSAAATTAPCQLMLVDLLGFYRVTSVTTTTAQTLTNTLTALTTFTANPGTDVVTHSSGNLLNLSSVQLTTTTTLPAGLAAATNYFVIRLTDTTCKLATSYANAVAGTAIDITDAGTGTHTINTLLPRYTNGSGVNAFMWNTNATPLGAATPNLSIGYTNSEFTTGRATPAVLPVGKTAASNGLVLYSGSGSGKYGPYMPLQIGDKGIRAVDSVTISSSYVSGEFSIALAKTLFTIPITTLGVASERDLVNQLPSLPRVYDGACLVWMINSGVNTPTNSAIFGHLDFAWG
jgi:hypothetical protein